MWAGGRLLAALERKVSNRLIAVNPASLEWLRGAHRGWDEHVELALPPIPAAFCHVSLSVTLPRPLHHRGEGG